MLLVPSASPFEIYGASTALLRKFQSSTYHRYASGWNLLSALYLLRLFAKGISEAARMPLVLRSNDVFAAAKTRN